MGWDLGVAFNQGGIKETGQGWDKNSARWIDKNKVDPKT